MHLLLQGNLVLSPCIEMTDKEYHVCIYVELALLLQRGSLYMLALLMLCISSFSLMLMNPIHTLPLVPNSLCQPVEDEITT